MRAVRMDGPEGGATRRWSVAMDGACTGARWQHWYKERTVNTPNTMTAPYWSRHEDELHRTVARHLPYYEEAVAEHPNAQLPEDFEVRVRSQVPVYAPLIPRHEGGDRALFNTLMPVLALLASVHVVLRESGWTVDQIGRLTYEVFRRKFDEMPRIARRIARTIMVSGLFPMTMRGATRKMRASGRPDTFFIDYSFRRTPARTTTMHCTQCGMIQFMKAAGLDEMYRYCNMFDFAQADSFGLGLVQPACLGQGDAHCEYHFTRNPADTVYPPVVRRILGAPMET